jgi:hypothetical protein
LGHRCDEIEEPVNAVRNSGILTPHIPVVSVRMHEAWLLFDEAAIRCAAGNPNGNIPITLPAARSLDRIQNPKELLFDLLRTASGLSARRGLWQQRRRMLFPELG